MFEATRASIEIYPRMFELVDLNQLVKASSKFEGEVRIEYRENGIRKKCDLKDLMELTIAYPRTSLETNIKMNVDLLIEGRGEEQNNLIETIKKTIYQMHRDDLRRREMWHQREIEAEERKKPLSYKIAKYFKNFLKRD